MPASRPRSSRVSYRHDPTMVFQRTFESIANEIFSMLHFPPTYMTVRAMLCVVLHLNRCPNAFAAFFELFDELCPILNLCWTQTYALHCVLCINPRATPPTYQRVVVLHGLWPWYHLRIHGLKPRLRIGSGCRCQMLGDSREHSRACVESVPSHDVFKDSFTLATHVQGSTPCAGWNLQYIH